MANYKNLTDNFIRYLDEIASRQGITRAEAFRAIPQERKDAIFRTMPEADIRSRIAEQDLPTQALSTDVNMKRLSEGAPPSSPKPEEVPGFSASTLGKVAAGGAALGLAADTLPFQFDRQAIQDEARRMGIQSPAEEPFGGSASAGATEQEEPASSAVRELTAPKKRGTGEAPSFSREEFNELKAARRELTDSLGRLRQEYAKEKDSLRKQELTEQIVQGLGMLAGAYVGQREGVDMSGLKFEPSDWSARARQLSEDMRSAAGIEKEKYEARRDLAAAQARDTEAERNFQERRRAEDIRAGERAEDLDLKVQQANQQADYLNTKLQQGEEAANISLLKVLAGKDSKQAANILKESQKIKGQIDNILLDKMKNAKSDEETAVYVNQIRELNQKYKDITGTDLNLDEALEDKPAMFFGTNPPERKDLLKARAAPAPAPRAVPAKQKVTREQVEATYNASPASFGSLENAINYYQSQGYEIGD